MFHLVLQLMGAITSLFGSSETLGILCSGCFVGINILYLPLCAYRLKKRGTSWYRRISLEFALLFLSVVATIIYNGFQFLAQWWIHTERITPESAHEMYSTANLADIMLYTLLFYILTTAIHDRRVDLEAELKEIEAVEEKERIMRPLKSGKLTFIGLVPTLIWLGAMLRCASKIYQHESTFSSTSSASKCGLTTETILKYTFGCQVFLVAVVGFQLFMSLRRLNSSVYRTWDRQAFPSLLFVFSVGLLTRIALAESVLPAPLGKDAKVVAPLASVILVRGAAQVWIVRTMLKKGHARVRLAEIHAEEASLRADVEAQRLKAQARATHGEFKPGDLEVIVEEDPALISLEGNVSDKK